MQVLEIARGVAAEDNLKRPYLDLSVYLNSDGTFSGDVVLPTGTRRLPAECQIQTPERFFAIQEKLKDQKEYLRATEHLGEIVITLRDSQFNLCCCFLLSQIASDSPLRGAMDELLAHIAKITDPSYKPKRQTAAEKRKAAINRKFALHAATQGADIRLIEEILKLYPEQLHAENEAGLTPLEQAVWFGSSAAVRHLIKHGANVNVKSPSGQTPLHVACLKGDLEQVTLLVKNGADIEAKTEDGDRPIHSAVMANQQAVVRYLQDEGALFNAKDEATRAARKIGRQFKSTILFLIFAGVSLFVAGCSSVITHSIARASSPPPPMYMGGLRMDYLAIAESETWGPQVYGVVDMPFSLIADVILLPYDLYADCWHTDDPEPTSE